MSFSLSPADLLPQDWGPQAVGASITRNFDASPALIAGDTIASITSLIASTSYGGAPADLTLTNQAIEPVAKQRISFTCAGGSYTPTNQPKVYYVALTVLTTSGETLIMTSILRVQPT